MGITYRPFFASDGSPSNAGLDKLMQGVSGHFFRGPFIVSAHRPPTPQEEKKYGLKIPCRSTSIPTLLLLFSRGSGLEPNPVRPLEALVGLASS
jgi:hypothetical protein